MKKLQIVLGIIALSLFLVSAANSAMIVDLIGDKDGFGIGAESGSSFDWTAIGSGDGDGTDVWMYGDYSYTHTYDISELSEPISYATLEIFTGGQGWYGESSIHVDSTLVGTLSDGDTDDGGSGENIAWLDTFDLTPYASLIDGAETITIDTVLSGDGWSLDYSEFTLSDDGTAPVPEPSTILLMGVGLLGLVGFNRKRFSRN